MGDWREAVRERLKKRLATPPPASVGRVKGVVTRLVVPGFELYSEFLKKESSGRYEGVIDETSDQVSLSVFEPEKAIAANIIGKVVENEVRSEFDIGAPKRTYTITFDGDAGVSTLEHSETDDILNKKPEDVAEKLAFFFP